MNTSHPEAPAARKRVRIPVHSVFGDPVCLLAFGFGSGLSPIAPGTAGTLAALPFVWLALSLPLPSYLILTALLFAAGVWLCGRCEQILGIEDHSGIVFDEFVGLFITFAGVTPTLSNLLLGFVLFRLFDAWKPWPIRWFDHHVHGGFGIMLDDLLAGALAAGVLASIRQFGLL